MKMLYSRSDNIHSALENYDDGSLLIYEPLSRHQLVILLSKLHLAIQLIVLLGIGALRVHPFPSPSSYRFAPLRLLLGQYETLVLLC